MDFFHTYVEEYYSHPAKIIGYKKEIERLKDGYVHYYQPISKEPIKNLDGVDFFYIDINHPEVEKAINIYGKERIVLIFDTENLDNLLNYQSNNYISDILKSGLPTTNKLPKEFEENEPVKFNTILVDCVELISKLTEAENPQEILKLISTLYGNSDSFPNVDKLVFKNLDILIKFSNVKVTKFAPSKTAIAFLKNDIPRNSINLKRMAMEKIILYLLVYPFVYSKILRLEFIINSGVLDNKNLIVCLSQIALNLGLTRNQIHYEVKNLDTESLIKYTNMRVSS